MKVPIVGVPTVAESKLLKSRRCATLAARDALASLRRRRRYASRLAAALLLAALPHAACAKKKSGSKKSAEEPILELTDATVEDALKKNPLMLISFTVPGCADCELVAKALRQAKAELRVQSADSVTLAQLTITSQESPAVAVITRASCGCRSCSSSATARRWTTPAPS